MEKRKKNTVKALGVYVGIFLFCVGIGFLIGKSEVADGWKKLPLTVLLTRIFVVYFLFLLSALIHIIVHEAGHMVAALLRGWNFLSFMIMGVVLSRREGHFHLSRFSLAGAGGQCLMLPPKDGDTAKGILIYNAGGILANLLLTVCLFVPLLVGFDSLTWVTSAFLICGVLVGVFMILMNGIPHALSGIPNDGMNILKLHKDAFSSQIFLHTMEMAGALMMNDTRKINSMPYICDGHDIDFTNVLHVMALSTDLSLAMFRMDFEKARTILQRIEPYKEQLIPIYRNELAFDRIFLTLTVPHEKADIECLLDSSFLKYLKQQSVFRPSALRVQYALALLHESDNVKAERLYLQFQKTCRTYYVQGEVEAEKRLVEYVRRLQES